MIRLFLLGLLLPLLGQANPLATTKHTVFLLHGFGGDRTTFLGFEEAFRAQLGVMGLTNTVWEFKHFVYDTVKSGERAKDFTKPLDQMIYEHFGSDGPSEKEKFSFVGHSQGGLIASMWIYYTMERRNQNAPEILKNLDSLVTLGTPFWGSRGAVLGLRPPNLLLKILSTNFFSVLGHRGDNEFESMSMGSDAIYNFRNGLIKLSEQEALRKIYLPNFRILNVAGFLRLDPRLIPLKFVPKEYQELETDGAVSLPSSRIDQLYFKDERSDYVHGDFVDQGKFRATNWGNQIIVPAFHLGINALYGKVYSPWVEAQVPPECQISGHCSHPAFMGVFLHLIGQPVGQGVYRRKSAVRSFLIDLNIRVPKNSNISIENIEIKWSASRDSSRIGHMESPLEAGKREGRLGYEPSLYPSENSEWRYFRYYFMGYLTDENPRALAGSEAYNGILSIAGMGIRPRRLQVAFKPTFSTFIDVPVFPLGRF